jgi:hypothetical protein
MLHRHTWCHDSDRCGQVRTCIAFAELVPELTFKPRRTRIQIDPALAKKGMVTAARSIVGAEGTKGLFTGFGCVAGVLRFTVLT